MSKRFWVKGTKKNFGPFDLGQLQTLVSNGKLQRKHRISCDQEHWAEASRISRLAFPVHESRGSNSPAEEVSIPGEEVSVFDALPPVQSPAELAPVSQPTYVRPNTHTGSVSLKSSDLWFANLQGQELGPIPSRKLIQLANAGTLQPTDLVRASNSVQWLSARAVEELTNKGQPIDPVSAEVVIIPRGSIGERVLHGIMYLVFFFSVMYGLPLLLGGKPRELSLSVSTYLIISGCLLVIVFVSACFTWTERRLRKLKSGILQIVDERMDFCRMSQEVTDLTGLSHIRLAASGESQSIWLDEGEFGKSEYQILSTEDDELFSTTRKEIERLTGFPCYRARDISRLIG